MNDELYFQNSWPEKVIKPCFQARLLSEVLTIAILRYATIRIWNCAEPRFKLYWVNLCSYLWLALLERHLKIGICKSLNSIWILLVYTTTNNFIKINLSTGVFKWILKFSIDHYFYRTLPVVASNCLFLVTIVGIILSNFSRFWCKFGLSKVKGYLISSAKYIVYKLMHELTNDLRLAIFRNTGKY